MVSENAKPRLATGDFNNTGPTTESSTRGQRGSWIDHAPPLDLDDLDDLEATDSSSRPPARADELIDTSTERRLTGVILNHGQSAIDLAGVSADDFGSLPMRTIVGAVEKVLSDAPDIASDELLYSVEQQLGDKLNTVGGLSGLTALMTDAPSVIDTATPLGEQVRRMARARRGVETGSLLVERIAKGRDPDYAIEVATERLTTIASSNADWPEPAPLKADLFPVAALDAKLLPGAIRPWLVDIAERIQCPLEYAAAPTIVALGSLIGRRLAIQPKRHDDWTEVPNLWGAIVGPTGVQKSPSSSQALGPMHRLELQAQEEYDRAVDDRDFAAMVAEAEQKELKKRIEQAVKKGESTTLLRAEYSAVEDPPAPRRYVVSDPTVEKLGELLNQNPNGLLLYRDELPGFLNSLEKDGHESDRQFYLEAWNGKIGFTYDRIKRGTIRIGAACVSIFGTIQPGPLAGLVRRAENETGAEADGMLQRFQVLFYPDVSETFVNVDRPPDHGARSVAESIFDRIDRMPTTEPGDTPRCLHFAPDAQEFFDQWRIELETKLRSGKLDSAMAGHLAKYRKLMPVLALIFEVCNNADPTAISLLSAQQAAAWCATLEEHAKRIYGVAGDVATTAARRIGDHIKSGALGWNFTERDVYRKGWAGLTKETVAPALPVLEAAGWIRSRHVKTGGAPTTTYTVNPALRRDRR